MMKDVNDLLNRLVKDKCGRIFLINLKRTLDSGLNPRPVKWICTRMVEQYGGLTPEVNPSVPCLLRELSKHCVNEKLWYRAAEPDMARYLRNGRLVLSRTITYEDLFSLLKIPRDNGAIPTPPKNGVPQLVPGQIRRIRSYLRKRLWRSQIEETTVTFSSPCVWLAPLSELHARFGLRHPSADEYRNLVGLSHYSVGQHLVRIDVDLTGWFDNNRCVRRRPHGAGNGGNRFMATFDETDVDKWGRTVNLSVVARKSIDDSLDGVPELLMAPFAVSRNLVATTYIGQVKEPPEENHAFFLKRIAKGEPFRDVLSSLRKSLS
jgi:hypothetical protein